MTKQDEILSLLGGMLDLSPEEIHNAKAQFITERINELVETLLGGRYKFALLLVEKLDTKNESVMAMSAQIRGTIPPRLLDEIFQKVNVLDDDKEETEH